VHQNNIALVFSTLTSPTGNDALDKRMGGQNGVELMSPIAKHLVFGNLKITRLLCNNERSCDIRIRRIH